MAQIPGKGSCISEFTNKNFFLSGHCIKATVPCPWCSFFFLPCAFHTFPIKNLDWIPFKLLIVIIIIGRNPQFVQVFPQTARINLWVNIAGVCYPQLLNPLLFLLILLLDTPSFIGCFLVFPWDISVKNSTLRWEFFVCLNYWDFLRLWCCFFFVVGLWWGFFVCLFFWDVETPEFPISFQIQCVQHTTSPEGQDENSQLLSLFRIADSGQKTHKILLQMAELHPGLIMEGSIDSSKWVREKF